jgi:hypothetical protein
MVNSAVSLHRPKLTDAAFGSWYLEAMAPKTSPMSMRELFLQAALGMGMEMRLDNLARMHQCPCIFEKFRHVPELTHQDAYADSASHAWPPPSSYIPPRSH